MLYDGCHEAYLASVVSPLGCFRCGMWLSRGAESKGPPSFYSFGLVGWMVLMDMYKGKMLH